MDLTAIDSYVTSAESVVLYLWSKGNNSYPLGYPHNKKFLNYITCTITFNYNKLGSHHSFLHLNFFLNIGLTYVKDIGKKSSWLKYITISGYSTER